MKGRILVTPRSLTFGHPALERLSQAGFEIAYCTPGKQPSVEELLNILPTCVGYLAGVERITSAVLRAAKQLKVISRNGVGTDSIDVVEAENLNIQIETASGSNAQSVAELTIALLLASARSLPFHDALVKKEKWIRVEGFELKNKKLGIIGCGNIGKRVARIALNLDMDVVGYDHYQDNAFNPTGKFRYVPLETLLCDADIVTLHCPPSQDKKPIIDAEALHMMKKEAVIINTARADLVDEKDLLYSLENNLLRAYATDVYQQEPPKLNRLFHHPSVITTPHIGGFTRESVQRATEIAVENLLKHLQ